MKTITLDLKKMTSIPGMHKYLQRVLALPDYYGKNLDALYDCLSTYPEPLTVEVPQAVGESKYLGDYGKQLLQVFQDAAEDNADLTVKLI